jgi:hypothetical protein
METVSQGIKDLPGTDAKPKTSIVHSATHSIKTDAEGKLHYSFFRNLIVTMLYMTVFLLSIFFFAVKIIHST